MPTISVNKNLLFQLLGRSYTEEEFADLCFDFGLELDEVTTEKEMIAKEQGADKSAGASEEVIFRIEIPANRYDLLCIEGLVSALLIFQQKKPIPEFKKKPGSCQLLVKSETKQVRPYVVAAVLRGVKFDQSVYDSFIELQDKLHQNLCRKRSLVAIGTHDLDTIHSPFTYEALPPKDIVFKALNQTQEYSAEQLMDLYSGNSHLKAYLPIIRDKPVYPVIYDKNRVVLSMPPIINGEHSKITLNTKNIFIECTATDKHKAEIVLDTMVCMFSQYCAEPFVVETVEVVYDDGSKYVYPTLEYRDECASVDYINSRLGLSKSAQEICDLLQKMGLKSVVKEEGTVSVTVPPTRHDILHECDIMEDVGIAFGYNNIEWTFPNAQTVGQQLSLNKLSDQLRYEISRCGFTEALTFSLCSKDDIAKRMRDDASLEIAVTVSNPKTIDFEVARTSLIPGLLKTVHSNKKMPLPMKLFEISDVVLKDKNTEVGARNERRLCALNYNKTPGFEVIHGLLDRIMQVLNICYSPEKNNNGYYIKSCQDNRFLLGRCAEIVVDGSVVGVMGVLHPEVIGNFELTQPCAALELNVEKLTYKL